MKTNKFIFTSHAKERIRQRLGLTSETAAAEWIKNAILSTVEKRKHGNTVEYITETHIVVMDGMKVVTVKPCVSTNAYLTKLGDMLTKEVTKLMADYKRELRKADIAVAEAQLNYLKARNPKVKDAIRRKLTQAIEWKSSVENEINNIEYAGKRYGVEL